MSCLRTTPESGGHSGLLPPPLQILEHAVTAWRPAFVLKTDDDAFVNVPALLRTLRTLCATPRCRGRERLYVGAEVSRWRSWGRAWSTKRKKLAVAHARVAPSKLPDACLFLPPVDTPCSCATAVW